MTDYQIDTSVTTPRVDTRWRTSKFGKDHARPGTLDLEKFIEGTHYNIGSITDNVIPSGVAVTLNATSKLYEPWVADADPEASKPLAGYINDDQGIDLFRRGGVAKSTKSSFALLVHGILDASRLPVVAQRTTVQTAPSTGNFIYV